MNEIIERIEKIKEVRLELEAAESSFRKVDLKKCLKKNIKDLREYCYKNGISWKKVEKKYGLALKSKSLKNASQSDKAKAMYDSPVINILKNKVSRKELSELLNTSDAQARRMVSECAMYYPVISYTDSKNPSGYRIARNQNELNDAELELEVDDIDRTLNEINSRIKILKKREKHLIAYKKVAEKRLQK